MCEEEEDIKYIRCISKRTQETVPVPVCPVLQPPRGRRTDTSPRSSLGGALGLHFPEGPSPYAGCFQARSARGPLGDEVPNHRRWAEVALVSLHRATCARVGAPPDSVVSSRSQRVGGARVRNGEARVCRRWGPRGVDRGGRAVGEGREEAVMRARGWGWGATCAGS